MLHDLLYYPSNPMTWKGLGMGQKLGLLENLLHIASDIIYGVYIVIIENYYKNCWGYVRWPFWFPLLIFVN